MDSLFCCSEVTAPSSRGLVQKFLMDSLFCCSEGTAPSSRGKVQVQNILMRSCCRREEMAPSSRAMVLKIQMVSFVAMLFGVHACV